MGLIQHPLCGDTLHCHTRSLFPFSIQQGYIYKIHVHHLLCVSDCQLLTRWNCIEGKMHQTQEGRWYYIDQSKSHGIAVKTRMPRVSQIIYIFQRRVTKKQKALDSKLCTNDSKAWVSMIESKYSTLLTTEAFIRSLGCSQKLFMCLLCARLRLCSGKPIIRK